MDDLPHGQGKVTFPNGNIYDGEIKFGKAHGYGIHTWLSGARYEGQWHEGKYDG